MSDEIDDDKFKYDGSEMSQCISGFGQNARGIVGDIVLADTAREQLENTERAIWHIEELVRWCRHFNGKCKLLENQLKEMGK